MTAPISQEAERRDELRRMKRRATALLGVVAVVFALTLLGDDAGWLGFVRAAAEGSMVGGLADWFAVTALFRHPLGIPIPHTAVVRSRKDQFGRTLGAFVQENFLSAPILTERLRHAHAVERAGEWLADPGNAGTVAAYVSDALVGAADVVSDDDVHRVMNEELERVLRQVKPAQLAGRALGVATEQGRHQPVVSDLLRRMGALLEENRPALRDRFSTQSRWWVPDTVEQRIFDNALARVQALLHEMAEDPGHELRLALDVQLQRLLTQWRDRPEDPGDSAALKHELLAHPELRDWTSGLWTELKRALREAAEDPGSSLRLRIADVVSSTGTRVVEDVALQAKLQGFAESAVTHVAVEYADEIAELVAGTISRWDGEATSDKLELLLGRDLQFIRINGTIVGGLAGTVIHALVVLTG